MQDVIIQIRKHATSWFKNMKQKVKYFETEYLTSRCWKYGKLCTIIIYGNKAIHLQHFKNIFVHLNLIIHLHT